MGSLIIGFMLLTTLAFAECSWKRFEKYLATTDRLIQEAGLPWEEHFTVTSDGYILRMFRIPPPKNGSGTPILLAHGMSASSDYWLLQGPKRDLAFILNKAGYDVWLGDFRGNYYSRNHTILNPDKETFWKFSLHEMGAYDIPAMIDHMINVTGHKKVAYIGHSMGTTVYFICMSTWPEYNEKVFLFIGLSPTVLTYLEHTNKGQRAMLKALSTASSLLYKNWGLELFRREQFSFMPLVLAIFCSENSITQDICHDILTWWVGEGHKSLSRKTLPLIFSHIPSGVGLLCFIQYIQNLKASKFRRLDYGKEKNIEVYGNADPPTYNLSLVTSPVALYYSYKDASLNPKDTKQTISKLPNVVHEYVEEAYTHADYVFSLSAWKEVYPDILQLIESKLPSNMT